MNYSAELELTQPGEASPHDLIPKYYELNQLIQRIKLRQVWLTAEADRAYVQRQRDRVFKPWRTPPGAGPEGARPGLSVSTYHAAISTGAPGPRPLSHLVKRQRGEIGADEYRLIKRQGKLTLEADMVGLHEVKLYDHERGKVTRFSKESRKRFLDKMLSIDWLSIKAPKYFITLTYPENFPLDGKQCKAHLDAWTKRIKRALGPIRYAWKREFQKRGAPHYHLYAVIDTKKTKQEIYDAVRDSWGDVIGNDNPAHRQAGTQTERIRKPLGAASYLALYMCKADQETVPTERRRRDGTTEPIEFINPGRWWGFCGKLPIKVEAYQITAFQYEQGFHLIREYWKSSGLPDYRCNTRIELIDFSPALEKIFQEIIAEA